MKSTRAPEVKQKGENRFGNYQGVKSTVFADSMEKNDMEKGQSKGDWLKKNKIEDKKLWVNIQDLKRWGPEHKGSK